MNCNELKAPAGARPRRKRVGRGHACHVKTAGRGQKGQNSRSGGGKGPAFEGGQTPWYRRLPKYRGFKNRFRTEYTVISLKDLDRFEAGHLVTPEALLELGLVKNLVQPVKVLGNGELGKALTVQLHAFTGSARAAIEQAGGSVEVI